MVNTKEINEPRKSNFELCRILAMVFIVLNHSTSLGQAIDGTSFSGNILLSLFFYTGGKMGTNVFLIISLYFLVDKGTHVNFKRILAIWLETLFYTLLLNAVDIVFLGAKINKDVWIRSFFPILGRTYWFPSAYIVLLLMIPFIKNIWENISRKKEILIVLGLAFSIIPLVTLNGEVFSKSNYVGWIFRILRNEFIWFPFLYILIDYVKSIGLMDRRRGKKFWTLIFCISYGTMWIIEIVMLNAGMRGSSICLRNYSVIREMTSIVCLLSSLSFFMFFKELEIGCSKLINAIGGMTFGIYLFHCHESSIHIIYKELFKFKDIVSHATLLQYILISIVFLVTVFSIAILIEMFRKKIECVIFSNSKIDTVITDIQRKLDIIYSNVRC